MPIDKQYVFCYSETRIYAKYLEVGSIDEKVSIICVEKADKAVAEAAFKALGFVGVDLSPLDEVVGVLDRESVVNRESDKTHTQRFLSNLGIEVNILKNLVWKSAASLDYIS
jgi:hypothetical protein